MRYHAMQGESLPELLAPFLLIFFLFFFVMFKKPVRVKRSSFQKYREKKHAPVSTIEPGKQSSSGEVCRSCACRRLAAGTALSEQLSSVTGASQFIFNYRGVLSTG